jgi:ATP-dependent DNA ligase
MLSKQLSTSGQLSAQHFHRKKGAQMKLYSRPGNDLTYRSPLIVETLARLRSRS